MIRFFEKMEKLQVEKLKEQGVRPHRAAGYLFRPPNGKICFVSLEGRIEPWEDEDLPTLYQRHRSKGTSVSLDAAIKVVPSNVVEAAINFFAAEGC